MKEKNEALLVDVFTGSLWEAELIKGLLESNGVQAALKDGLMNVIAPYLTSEVSVQVNENDYEAAMTVVRERESKNDDE